MPSSTGAYNLGTNDAFCHMSIMHNLINNNNKNQQAVVTYNSQVSVSDIESTLASPITQKVLSGKVEEQLFKSLLESSSPLSVSAPHAASWLSVIPFVGLGLHLESRNTRLH